MRTQPRRAKIALISGFGAVVLATRLYGFHIDRPGVAGAVATVAIFVLLIGGAIAIYIGFTSLSWTNLRSKLTKRRRP